MLQITNLPSSEVPNREQSIRVNRHTPHINVKAVVFRFRDKDTNQFVLYMPALEISSYGETQDKAMEMFKIALDDLFEHLMSLSKKDMEAELFKLGFKQKMFSNKVYSKSFVDTDGNLHTINAVEGEVELLSVEG